MAVSSSASRTYTLPAPPTQQIVLPVRWQRVRLGFWYTHRKFCGSARGQSVGSFLVVRLTYMRWFLRANRIVVGRPYRCNKSQETCFKHTTSPYTNVYLKTNLTYCYNNEWKMGRNALALNRGVAAFLRCKSLVYIFHVTINKFHFKRHLHICK